MTPTAANARSRRATQDAQCLRLRRNEQGRRHHDEREVEPVRANVRAAIKRAPEVDRVIDREQDPDDRVRDGRRIDDRRVGAGLLEQQHRNEEQREEEDDPIAEHRVTQPKIRAATESA